MIKKSLTLVCLVAGIGFSGSVFAYGSEYSSNGCKKPRFKSFTPEHKSEVDPESEISFTVSGYTEPGSIEVVAKKVPLKPNINFNGTYYTVTAKLPASLTGKYARIHVNADAMMGCNGKDGWLLKIRDKAEAQ